MFWAVAQRGQRAALLWGCLVSVWILFMGLSPRQGELLGGARVGPLTRHVNLAETHRGYLVLKLNHDRRLGSKCRKGLGQEECECDAGFF